MTKTPRLIIHPGNRSLDAESLGKALAADGVRVTVSCHLRGARASHVLLLTKVGDVWSPRDEEDIARILERKIHVVAAFDSTESYTSQAPNALFPINGFAWRDGEELTKIATYYRRLMGVDDSERRVFLSYARDYSSTLTRHLRYKLIDSGWDVFLDRFGVQPGARFQQELFRDLDARTIVLVIEHPKTRLRRWVDDEIAFANSSGVGLCALYVRELPKDSDRRFPKSVSWPLGEPGFAANSPLHEKECDELIDFLQKENTRSYFTRSDDSVECLLSAIHQQGLTPERVDAVSVLGRDNNGDVSQIARATSQRPSVVDLAALLEIRTAHARSNPQLTLIHRLNDPDTQALRPLIRVADELGISVRGLADYLKVVFQ